MKKAYKVLLVIVLAFAMLSSSVTVFAQEVSIQNEENLVNQAITRDAGSMDIVYLTESTKTTFSISQVAKSYYYTITPPPGFRECTVIWRFTKGNESYSYTLIGDGTLHKQTCHTWLNPGTWTVTVIYLSVSYVPYVDVEFSVNA